MKIDGKTKLLGLIGNPVEHTLSPVIHNTLAHEMGINACYVPFLVLEEAVHTAVKGAYALNIQGMNVTVPHKQAVIDCLSGIDPLAEQIGAVNTLVRTEGGFTGYNTDALGFIRELKQENVSIEGETAVILGAGGASRAVVFSLAKEGIGKMYLLNRSVEKAEKLAKQVNDCFGKQIVFPLAMDQYRAIEEDRLLAVQCTSVGLSPECDRCVITDDAFYRKVHTGVDLIYKPSKTLFMKLVEKNGGNAYNGLKMLFYQGVTAFELFLDVQVTGKVAKKVYQRLCEELEHA